MPPAATPLSNGGGTLTPPPVDPNVAVLANQYIDLAWEFAYEALPSQTGTLTVINGDYWALRGLMSLTTSAPNVSLTRDAQNRVVTRETTVSASASRSGVPAAVCSAIASRALPGISCTGGTVTATLSARVVEQFVSDGVLRDFETMPHFDVAVQWTGLDWYQIQAATPLSGNWPGYVHGL